MLIGNKEYESAGVYCKVLSPFLGIDAWRNGVTGKVEPFTVEYDRNNPNGRRRKVMVVTVENIHMEEQREERPFWWWAISWIAEAFYRLRNKGK